jgi:hypothetical protein
MGVGSMFVKNSFDARIAMGDFVRIICNIPGFAVLFTGQYGDNLINSSNGKISHG